MTGWLASKYDNKMKTKTVKIKSNKVKMNKIDATEHDKKTKTPKLEHGKMKNNPMQDTLMIKILGSMVIWFLLRLELGNYLEAGSDFIENDTLARILENSTQPKPGGNDSRVLD